MASFTEQATLKVVDQSSAQIRKINAELKKLFATARSLKSVTVGIKINTGNLQAANRQLSALAHNMARLRGQSMNLRVNQQGISAATAAIARLQAQAARGITVHTRQAGGGAAGGGGGVQPPGRRYGGGYGRTPGGAFLGGFGGGVGIGLGRLNESFGTVALAGYAAAKALSAVASAAQARDRAQLAVDTQTSAVQRAVFAEADKAAKAAGLYKGALRYKEDQFNLARASFLGDVGNTQKDIKKGIEGVEPKSREGEIERAVRADLLARTLYRDVVPGMYARNPELSQVQAQEELKKFVQTLGITTQKMFEVNEQGRLAISKDAERVMEGIRLAQIGAPDLTMSQIRTAAASIKSLGYSAKPDQIAEILYNVSAKGQRAANEAYQMYKTGLGTVDVAKLNKAINDLGLFVPGTAEPTKKGIKAGTGLPVEFADEQGPIKLGERPSEWWRKAMDSPEVQKRAREMLIKQASQAPLPPGKTRAQAIAEAKDKYKDDDALAITDYVNRALAGARGTALQGILDAILGGPIAKAGLAQADVAPGPAEINKRMEESWSVQASNLGTAVSDAAAKLGELAASAIGLSGILKGMTNFVDQNPLASGAIAIALGAAVGAAMIVPAGMLTAAAGALMRAAAALTLGGAGGGLPGGGGKILRIGGQLMRVVGGVATALTAAEVATYIATRTEEQAKEDEKRVQATKDLAQKESSAARIEREQAIQRDAAQSPRQQAYMAEQAVKLEGIKAEIARLKAVLDERPPEVKPEALPDATPATQAAINAAVTQAVRDYQKIAPPTATAAATTTAAVAPTDTLATLIPQLAATSNSINLAVSSLTTAGTTFATVFQTGATSIGTAGQTAANTLTAAAPSIGAAIGAAAASAIRAATANISVNVNNNTSGAAPAGTQRATD